ncbi:MAG: lipoprotein [Rhodanobacter sp.]
MRRSILLLPFCFAVATLAGCGNKGPLVMPPAKAAATAPAPVQPAPASSALTPTQQP